MAGKDDKPDDDNKPDDDKTEDELAGLSPEERAALEEEEEELDDASGGDDAGDDKGGEGKGEGEGEEEDKEAAAAPEPVGEFYPQFKAGDEIPADPQARLNELEESQSTLDTTFEKGEIGVADYNKQSRLLQREERALETAVANRDTVNRTNQQTREQAWDHECERFYGEHNEVYGATTGEMMKGAMGMVLQGLYSDEVNQGKSFRWFLEEAHKEVLKVAPTVKPEDIPNKQGDGTGAGPKTLGEGIPASGEQDVGKDEFAHLDALDGMALENELARMNPTQVEKYLDTRTLHQ